MRGNSEHIVTGMAALPPGFTTRAHSHAAEEVAVFLRGSGRVDIDGVPHRVEAGTVLVTPSDLVHVTHSDPGEEPLVVLWFYAPPGSEARWVEPERHETGRPRPERRRTDTDGRLAGGHRHRRHVHRPRRHARSRAPDRQGALDPAGLRAGRPRRHRRRRASRRARSTCWPMARPSRRTRSSRATGRPTALLTTAGFRDVLQLGRHNRGEPFDILWDPPAPLVAAPPPLRGRASASTGRAASSSRSMRTPSGPRRARPRRRASRRSRSASSTPT